MCERERGKFLEASLSSTLRFQAGSVGSTLSTLHCLTVPSVLLVWQFQVHPPLSLWLSRCASFFISARTPIPIQLLPSRPISSHHNHNPLCRTRASKPTNVDSNCAYPTHSSLRSAAWRSSSSQLHCYNDTFREHTQNQPAQPVASALQAFLPRSPGVRTLPGLLSTGKKLFRILQAKDAGNEAKIRTTHDLSFFPAHQGRAVLCHQGLVVLFSLLSSIADPRCALVGALLPSALSLS